MPGEITVKVIDIESVKLGNNKLPEFTGTVTLNIRGWAVPEGWEFHHHFERAENILLCVKQAHELLVKILKGFSDLPCPSLTEVIPCKVVISES